ncbi:acetolactate synthase catalytic subunit [Streptomyces malaysiensis]|uniref:acetolactate synthase catalytic subunit n=1 Tax=Streptomyces malaysiensis TaxID=92644 RepID=UPI002B2E6BEC|nr:acetolactate synthase catalytic subunit [Streptomyces malaysiensis]
MRRKLMSDTVADALAGALARHGVTSIFGQSNPTALMLAAERIGIRQILYRTENAAGAMADGFARVGRRVAVVAAQNGPAATLMVPPMAEALKASVPMLVLVQEVPASDRDRNAFQELDHFALFAGVSKWTRRVDDPSRVEDNVDMAMTVANSGRPGPVVLLLPKDVLQAPAVPPRFGRRRDLGAFPLDRPRPEATAVAEAARLVAEARSPLVVAGGGVHLSDAVEELTALQRLAHLPVVTTNMGKGAVSELDTLSLGVAANVTGQGGPAHHHLPLIQQSDVVLLVGTRTNENGTEGWTLTSPDATYIHIDMDPVEVGRTYEALRLVGDARSALSDLADALAGCDLTRRQRAAESLRHRIATGRRRRADEIEAAVPFDAQPIAPERLLRELDELLVPDDIVVADASYSSFWVASHLTAKRAGQRFVLPRGLAGLGWGLPLGLGAKLATPDARVVAVVGDGGFAHVWSELETAVREDLALTLIVLNNQVLAAQGHAEMAAFGQTTTGIDFQPVDHAAMARAVGAAGIRITDPDQLEPQLKDALASTTVTVLDVVIDPDSFPPVRAFDRHADRIRRRPRTGQPTPTSPDHPKG